MRTHGPCADLLPSHQENASGAEVESGLSTTGRRFLRGSEPSKQDTTGPRAETEKPAGRLGAGELPWSRLRTGIALLSCRRRLWTGAGLGCDSGDSWMTLFTQYQHHK